MALLKQKQAVILFNTFLLEVTPLPLATTINSAALICSESGIYNGTSVFTTINTLWQVFTKCCSASPLQHSGYQGSIKLINGGCEEERAEGGHCS